MKPASGTFLLRVPPDLHRRLRALAARRGKSLNQLCRDLLEAAVAEPGNRAAGECLAALRAIRAYLASGGARRRLEHGHPYWVREENDAR